MITINNFLLLLSLISHTSVIKGERPLSYAELLEVRGNTSDESKKSLSSNIECTTTVDQSSETHPVTIPQFRPDYIPPLDLDNPFCAKFDDVTTLDGFDVCPGIFSNVEVTAGSVNSYNDPFISGIRNDDYLHVKDRPNASLVCGTSENYTGNWTPAASQRRYSLCFDVSLLDDTCKSSDNNCIQDTQGDWYLEYYPRIILQGGAPTYYRAVFIANDPVNALSNPSKWRTICAPIAPLSKEGELPSNEHGSWKMTAPNDILSGLPPVTGLPSANSVWASLLADVTAIQLPVDFTKNHNERIGYDNICLIEGEYNKICEPEPLCFWQHEWECTNLKKEEWYSNFTPLVGQTSTFNKKYLCVCELLHKSSTEICAFVEQEFIALLLNIASQRLTLDCNVEQCNKCNLTVKSIIKKVDKLLSSRSNYDCSKALEYLTGINYNEILCDSSSTPSQNPTSSSAPTIPFTNQPTFKKSPTKSPIKSPTTCEQSSGCAGESGECKSDCIEIDGQKCDFDLCEGELCSCQIDINKEGKRARIDR